MTSLVRAFGEASHRPDSHPVLQRARFHAELAKSLDRTHATLDPISATQVADQSARIDDIAARVASLGDSLTPLQRRSLLAICRELDRRVHHLERS